MTIPYKVCKSSDQEREIVENSLVKYNAMKVPFTQAEPFMHLGYHIKTPDGFIISGINALIYCWNCLYIEILWVDERFRHQGLGSILLNKVEKEAKTLGCELSHLDTFEFQAKDFYLRHGYTLFGQLDDCPKGHARFYLKKILS